MGKGLISELINVTKKKIMDKEHMDEIDGQDGLDGAGGTAGWAAVRAAIKFLQGMLNLGDCFLIFVFILNI